MDGTAELSKKGGRCGGTHDTHITMDATAEVWLMLLSTTTTYCFTIATTLNMLKLP